MGWDVSNISSNIKTKDYVYFDLKRGLNEKYEILAYGQGKRSGGYVPVYLAIKNKETGDVFAQITLTSRKNGFISQKDIDESAGPYAYDCPKSVFKLLTPTKSEFAQNWRKEVEKYHAQGKLVVGDKIVFEKEIDFTDGTKNNEFYWLGGSKFVTESGGKYRITNWRSYKHDVVKLEREAA
jgi:hypothetical protein